MKSLRGLSFAADADQEQDRRGDERERGRESALAMNEPFVPHLLALHAKLEHELDVIDDADHQHRDAERHQRNAEMPRRVAVAFQELAFPQSLEDLEDRESEADQGERSADHRHQRAVGAHARALERHSRTPRRQLVGNPALVGFRDLVHVAAHSAVAFRLLRSIHL
jgi:hypothetical protein